MAPDLKYLRQNSQRKSLVTLANSWGYGDEYQVEISYFPNWTALGERLMEPKEEG
jgi:hypothetical protein